jgi:peroxiredoxin
MHLRFKFLLRNLLIPFAIGLVNFAPAQAQISGTQTLPSVELRTLKGKPFNTAELQNDGRPMIISFWATWCKPCIQELAAIAELYPDWQAETGVKLVAVSIDDSRNTGKVGPFVNGRNWDYEVLLDPNSDLKRAMNVTNVPHTFLLNGQGEIVHQHTTYKPGDEIELYEKVLSLVK